MVYPRSNGSRSLAKFLAFCAINLCVLHGAQATAAASCTMVVSPGDAAVGTQIVTDSSCASGGLGCINNDCRFCKTKDTPQSDHFLECSAISVAPTTQAPTPAPTTAPTPAPTPSETKTGDTSSIDVCAASEGDQSVGIQAVSDDSCVNGGLGCFNGQCRFCKVRDAPQSGHLTACNALDPSFPTVAPSTPSPSAAPGTTCGVSQGDFAVGINAVVDPTCAFGGLGCCSDHCRFCKYRTTPQSGHFDDCSDYGTSDPIADTPALTGETPAPIAETPALTAETPTPTADTPVPFMPGWDTPAPTSDTPGPTFDTPAPTSGGPIGIVTDVTDTTTPCPSTTGPDGTPLEVVTPTPSTTNQCATLIDSGSAAVGIQLVFDASCKNGGGLGCIYDVCRYCQAWETSQPKHLSLCTPYSPDTPAPAETPASADTPALTPEFDTPAPGIDSTASDTPRSDR